MASNSITPSSHTRPKSTQAQIITAWLAAGIAAFLVLSAVVSLYVVSFIGQGIDNAMSDFDTSDSPSAVSQWLCLPYAEFVLEQHRAGLTTDEIAAVLEVSEYGRNVQGGVTQPKPEFDEPRLDSPEACGLPYEIIDAAGETPAS